MSYTSNQINSQSLNGIISLSDGVLNIEDGIISNIQQLKVVGNSELDGDLIVDGKITCAYNALLPSDVVNKNYVDDALNNNSRFLRVDGTNQMNANLNVGNKYIYNLLDPSGNQDASTKFYTDTADNLRLLKSGGIMTGILDLSGNRIIKLATGVDDTDCINKLQMVNADNLRLLKSGDTMTGILDLSANRIIKLATGIDDTDGINKLQMVNADNLRLLKSGDTMTGNLDMSGNNIININNLASATSSYLHLLIGNTIFIQLTPEQVIFRAPILINNIAVGGTGIYMAGTKIANLSNGTNPQDAINKQQMDDGDNLRLLKGGDTMTGGLNMGGNIITNLPYPSSDTTDATNKNYVDTEDNKRLRLDGSSAMTGNINCNGNNITNIGSIQSQIGSDLNLKIGTTNALQLQTTQASLSLLLNMNSNSITNAPSIGAGTSISLKIATLTIMQVQSEQLLMSKNINMGGNLITNVASVSSPTGTSLNLQVGTSPMLQLTSVNSIFSTPIEFNFGSPNVGINMVGTRINACSSITGFLNTNFIMNYWGTSVIPKITLTSGRTLITDGLKISNVGIDMSGNTITNLSNATSALDAVNKSQLDLKLNLGGGTLSGQLIFSGGGIDMSTYNMNNVSFIKSSGITPIYLSIDNVSKVKIDSSGLTMQNAGGIDMGSNTITKVSKINSNTTSPIIIQHNSVDKVKIDSSGIVMQNSGNLDMNNGTISNTTLTTPKITAPIQTTTSSSYSTINNSYLNIGYTVSNSYNVYTTMTQTTYYPLLAANNRITVDAGVWIITGSFNPFCISGTPDTQAIHMIVSNVNTATEWAAFPSSKVRQMFNGQANSTDSGYIVNTFVITLTAQTYLYLWGYVQYTGTSVAWAYNFAELRATRIA